MKKILFVVLFLMIASAAAAFAAPPAIFYSDLTSGPKTGGKDNLGVWVTITGKNFGASRGSSYVSIGGGQAAAYPVWTDKKICFQLGASANTGNIVVNTAEGASNGMGFTVRSGRIFFVDDTSPSSPGSGTYADPWRSPRSYFTAFQPGDTCYFRGGTYPDCYGNSSRPYNVSFYNSGRPSGSLNNEIAWVGYPGETALFRANSSTIYNGAFELSSNNQYFVIAGLSIYGKGDGREQVRLYSPNCKLVNCKIEGIKTLCYAMIGITASNLKIWGNECFGATSGNKLDHIIYFQGGGSYDNVDIGWNYFHDNDISVGPVFSWNLGSGQATNIRIHDNYLDCRNSSSILRLAGIWSGGGGSISFYNNFIVEAGGSLNNDNAYNAIYAGFGTTYIYNNTFFRCRGAGSSYVVNVYNGASAVVKNNIFYNQSSSRYVNLNSGSLTVDGNCYYGGAGSPPAGDAHPIAADPRFVNASAMDAHLAAGSPCVDRGSDLASVCPRDYDGVARLSGKYDLGAWEYSTPAVTPPPPPPPPDPVVVTTAAISGVVRDSLGNPVQNITMALSGHSTGTAVTNAGGGYQFSGLALHYAYSLTPSKAGYVFSPGTLSVSDLSGNMATGNFTAQRTTATVSGTVRDTQGNPMENVTVALSGHSSGTAVTGANGVYQLPGLDLHGAYALTPSKAGYVFAPGTIAISDLAGAMNTCNFTAQKTTAAISGTIRDLHGNPLANVAVALSGHLTGTTVTGANGVYQFPGLDPHNAYTLTPSLTGYIFNPQMFSVGDLAGNLGGCDFTGRKKLAIKGRISDKKGLPVQGAAVELSGDIVRQSVTDSSGSFQVADLPEGLSYTLKVVKSGFVFEPPVLSTASLSALIENWNFTGGFISNVLALDRTVIIGPSGGRGVINPDKGEAARIYFKGKDTGRYCCRIFNLSGEQVWESFMDNVQEGTFEWIPRSVASGIYTANISGPGINTRKKIALIR